MKKVIVIAGPTASGKTSISIELAKKLNGEIVSADSMQIYRDLNIGTAKPTESEMDGIPHHMINVCNPDEKYSVAEYVTEAEKIVSDIISRDKTPIVVGGTGLYIDSLVFKNDFGESKVDEKLRLKLNAEAEEVGGEAMLEKLRLADPVSAERLHPNDIKRIVRALEVYITTGKTISELNTSQKVKEKRFDFEYFVLCYENRATLYDRVEKRIDLMIEKGLIDEAKEVIFSSWYVGSTSSQAIGYKEFEDYFNGISSLEYCVGILKQHTRNYAKRQMTWFNNKDYIHYIKMDADNDPLNEIMKTIAE